MERSPYYLSEHAFFCLADNHYVFLDLRSDQYLCLGRAHTHALKGVLNGHNLMDERSAGIQLRGRRNSGPKAVIQALLQKELLVQDETVGKPTAPANVDSPAASLMERVHEARTKIGPTPVCQFCLAAVAASRDLRRGSLERTVRKVQARKSARATDAVAEDSSLIIDLFGTFQTLRPYYPRPYLCLFDSLALLHFLASYDVFPQWVYGVKLQPFAAHCWVQVGNRVVNDIVDNVRDYTPIMSI